MDLKDITKRMDGSIDSFKRDLAGLRTGRASASLLEPIQVDAYGSMMPMNQVGNISVPEPRMLSVQVWDNSLVNAAEKAIRNSDLGLNPMSEGNVIRVSLPDLTEDRRKDLAKVAGTYAEKARISIRNVRRDGMEQLKKMEKDSEISKDDLHNQSEEVQKLTDQHVKIVDDLLANKETEIMQV